MPDRLLHSYRIHSRRNSRAIQQKLHTFRFAHRVRSLQANICVGPWRATNSSAFYGPTGMNPPTTRSLLKTAMVAPLLCCFALAQQRAGMEAPSVASIVQRMEVSQSKARVPVPYQVIREYSLFGMKSSSANAEVLAQVNFTPPTSKDYSIQNWSGTTRGKQIVQRVLDHETKASKGNNARTAITMDNYDFALIGDGVSEGRPCYVIGLKPKRKEQDLISGSAWVDKSSFSILQIEGEAAKAPSWWLKSVRIKMSFVDFSGAWLQTSMEAVADVRLLGFYTLKSRLLDYRGSDMSASIRLTRPSAEWRSLELAH
jgi:hypothetical protein